MKLFHRITLGVLVVISGWTLATAPAAQAATGYTWTNTLAADYWTNSASWSPAGGPPATATGDSAFLTNQVNLVYSSVLDAGLANSLSVLAISNALGEAWLVVTNTSLTTTTLALGNGGRLQIDAGGMVSAANFTWLGTNGAIHLNSGQFSTTGPKAIGTSGNVTGLVTGAGVWNFNASGLTIGGVSGNDNLIRITDGAVLTNLAGLTLSGHRNSLILTNGSQLFGSGAISFSTTGSGNTLVMGDGFWNGAVGTLGVGNGANSSNNTLTGNAGILTNFLVLTVGGASGANFNSVTVTDGGRLVMTNRGTSQVQIGSASSGGTGGNNNSVVVSNSVLVSGTDNLSYVGYNSSSNSVTLLADSIWQISSQGSSSQGQLTIGRDSATGNVVTVAGGVITNGQGIGSMANGPSVIVGTGANSFGNALVVNNAGRLITAGGGIVVGLNGASDNRFTVAGGTVASSGLITVGGNGSGYNTATVTNGFVSSPGLNIGHFSSNNTVTILAGGTWSLGALGLNIGHAPSGGVGGALASTGNAVIVNGGIFTNIGTVTLGNDAGNAISAFNSLLVTNGGKMFINAGLQIGGPAPGSAGFSGSSNNTVSITGSGSVITNGGNVHLGTTGTAGSHPGGGNALTITDGGRLLTAGVGAIGHVSAGTGGGTNTVLVSDLDSAWWIGTSLTLGNAAGGTGNRLIISNSAAVTVGTLLTVGPGSNSQSNDVTLTGADSSLTIGGNFLISLGSYGTVSVTDGAKLTQFGTLSVGTTGHSNTFTVSGPDSVYQFSYSLAGNAIRVGAGVNATGNRFIVSDGGMVVLTNSLGSANSVIGGATGANNNSALVTGPGSVWTNLTAGATIQALVVGDTGAVSNSLVIADGGAVIATALTVGRGAGANDNSASITGGGLLQANTLTVSGGTGNTISNVGGIYQFTIASPTITPSAAGSIALTAGTISFHGISTADVTNNRGNGALRGITFAGANTFMLNAASNTTAGQTYTFESVAGNPSNYVNLALINGHTAYRGGALTIGATGSLLISQTTATVTGLFTNQGQASLVNASASFVSDVVNAGNLTLQNATLAGNVLNLAGGTLRGNGSIVGDVTSFGTNSPGFSAGTLSITGTVVFGSTAVTVMELFAGSSNDLISVAGALTYGGELLVTNVTGFGFAAGQSFQLFEFSSQLGTFGVTNLPDLSAYNLLWDTSQLDTAGLLSIAVVPEPSAVVLVFGGLLVLAILRRRR